MEFKGTKGFEEGFSEGVQWQAERMYNGKAPEMLEMLKYIVNEGMLDVGAEILVENLIKEATEIQDGK
jgi:hypothetical protein